MSDLYQKAQDLLNRMMFRSSDTRLHEFEQFLKDIKRTDGIVDISIQDLNEMHGYACHLASTMSHGEEVNGTRVFSDPKLLQSYCYFQAIYAKLKGKGLITHDIRLGDQKDANRKGTI